MIRILEDGCGHWVILRDDHLLGHINFSSKKCLFRALTVRGALSHHFTFTTALEAIKEA